MASSTRGPAPPSKPRARPSPRSKQLALAEHMGVGESTTSLSSQGNSQLPSYSLWSQTMDPLQSTDFYMKSFRSQRANKKVQRITDKATNFTATRTKELENKREQLKDWYNVLDAVEGQRSLVGDDAFLSTVEEWSKHARTLVEVRNEESRVGDQLSLMDLRLKSEEAEKAKETKLLRYECINACVNLPHRKRMKKQERHQMARAERALFDTSVQERRELCEVIWERTLAREEALHSSFSEGPALVSRFGELLASATREMAHVLLPRIAQLRQEGLLLGKLSGDSLTSIENSINRSRVVLNALDSSPSLRLNEDDTKVTHLDEVRLTPDWASVRATRAPWMRRRNDYVLIKGMLTDSINDIYHARSRTVIIRTIARFLDAIHPTHQLHAQVLTHPETADEVTEKRLLDLGYTLMGGSLRRHRHDSALRIAAEDVLKQLRRHLDKYDRFYFEVRPPSESPWVIGLTTDTSVCSDFPGQGSVDFGFMSTGQLAFDGERKTYAAPYLNAEVIGILIDVREGSVSLHVDGVDKGPAFGGKSKLWGEDQGRMHSEWVQEKELVPVFALLGPSPVTSKRVSKKKGASGMLINRPTMVVNFGSDPFAHQPRDTLSPDSVLQRFEHTIQAEELLVPTRSHKLDERVSKRRQKFLDALMPQPAKSWSKFPPSSHRREHAARTLQWAFRGYHERMEYVRQKRATAYLQHWVRVVLPKIRARHNKAATVIQKLVRGRQARRIYAFAKQYGVAPSVLESAATTIQAHVRRTRARLAALQLAAKLQEEIRMVHNAAKTIQKNFRRFIFQYEPTPEYLAAVEHMNGWRQRTGAAFNIQAVWKKFKWRRNHHRWRVHKGAATQIQAWWRGTGQRCIGNYERFDYDDAFYLQTVARALTKAHFLVRRWQPTGLRMGGVSTGAAQYQTVPLSDIDSDDDLLGEL